MRDRWSTGWVLLPSRGRERAHRLDPDQPGLVMCSRPFAPSATVHDFSPTPYRCGHCTTAIGEARRRAAVKAALTAGRLPPVRDPDGVDRRDRAAARGTSLRTVSGGLPGLGRRHH